MKITKQVLKQVIKEELQKTMDEASSPREELIAKIGDFLYAMERGPERDDLVDSIIRVAESYHSRNAKSVEQARAAALAAKKALKYRGSDWAREKTYGGG